MTVQYKLRSIEEFAKRYEQVVRESKKEYMDELDMKRAKQINHIQKEILGWALGL
jgi:hypothetical protein